MKKILFTILLLCVCLGFLGYAQNLKPSHDNAKASAILNESFVPSPAQESLTSTYYQEYDVAIKTNVLATILFPAIRALADPSILPLNFVIEFVLDNNFSISPYAYFQFGSGFTSGGLGSELRWYIPVSTINRGPFLSYAMDIGAENYTNDYDFAAPEPPEPYGVLNVKLTGGYQFVFQGFLIEAFGGIGISSTFGSGYISGAYEGIRVLESGINILYPFGIAIGYAFW